jgi:hypothetical protein
MIVDVVSVDATVAVVPVGAIVNVSIGTIVSVSVGALVEVGPVGTIVNVSVGTLVEVGAVGELVIEGTGEFVIVGVGETVAVGSGGGFVEVAVFVAVGGTCVSGGAELQVGPEIMLSSVVKELVSDMSRPSTFAWETTTISRDAMSVPANELYEPMVTSRPICQKTLQGWALPAITTEPENVMSPSIRKIQTSL